MIQYSLFYISCACGFCGISFYFPSTFFTLDFFLFFPLMFKKIEFTSIFWNIKDFSCRFSTAQKKDRESVLNCHHGSHQLNPLGQDGITYMCPGLANSSLAFYRIDQILTFLLAALKYLNLHSLKLDQMSQNFDLKIFGCVPEFDPIFHFQEEDRCSE